MCLNTVSSRGTNAQGVPEGKKIPVKGGSMTGNVFEMFGRAKFAKEKVLEDHYIGPGGIRFENISISGK